MTKFKEHIDPAYSKGLLGKIRTTLDRGSLIIAGGSADGQTAKARHLLSSLPPLPISADTPPHEVADITSGLREALGVMILSEHQGSSDERYIQHIGGADINNLPSIAMDLVPTANSIKQTAVRLVYGASEEMPFRALSYILPAVLYLEGMAHAGLKLPQLQIVFANHISTKLNNLNLSRTTDQSLRFSNFAKKYINFFFPELMENVVFLKDVPLEINPDIEKELNSLAYTLREKLPQTLLDELVKKGSNGSNNGNFETSLYYGAAHFLMHDLDQSDSLTELLDGQPKRMQVDNLISIGGYQETLFYRLRAHIWPELDEKYHRLKTLQYFTRHRVPPYYMARTGDLSLDEALKNNNAHDRISEAALFDILYMINVSNYRGDFAEFLERMRNGK